MTVQVYSLQGVLLLGKEEEQIDFMTLDLGEIPTGMYEVVLRVDDKMATEKIVVRRP